ncbi:hypothetical protein H6F61_22745 [Cyanobacteria bacterium FACHB-472]|nr:hypothetical protein [Cyanobacteria bacterium FACHB-472]
MDLSLLLYHYPKRQAAQSGHLHHAINVGQPLANVNFQVLLAARFAKAT